MSASMTLRDHSARRRHYVVRESSRRVFSDVPFTAPTNRGQPRVDLGLVGWSMRVLQLPSLAGADHHRRQPTLTGYRPGRSKLAPRDTPASSTASDGTSLDHSTRRCRQMTAAWNSACPTHTSRLIPALSHSIVQLPSPRFEPIEPITTGSQLPNAEPAAGQPFT
jgi:hypothetical protein